ncbi:exopolyphosphatase [Niallia sp. Man26]|uniref:Ppx/GppA phosphatase family protein n=1 Tax=Niallia sp. Man26 TaxID=2912824 RepID=UPI001EDA2ED5|nr:exopolyphosphatase [Niallia sp. Man26]UPO89786.1 exopolyphosphatase [Niallia sp. Man26]
MKDNSIAIIDLGSNSIQFAIYQIENNLVKTEEAKRVKVAARLISYVNSQGNITREGIDFTLQILKEFKKHGEESGVNRIIGFATAVIRNAANKEDVLAEIQQETGIPFSILSGYEEAYFGFLGIIQATDLQDGITIDIGGGSTEITLFRNRQMVEYHSFPFGAVNLNDQFTKGENVTAQQTERLQSYLVEQLQTLPWLSKAGLPVIGIGGSAKNLSRIHKAKCKKNSLNMSIQDIHHVYEELSSLSVTERANIKGLSKKRKDIIIPAVQIISILMEMTQSPYFLYCTQSVRDGFIYNLLEKTNNAS